MKNIKKLILLLVVVVLFAGCQPTPDREVVVNQNKDIIKEVQSRSETTASVSPEYLAKLELPEHYSYSTKNEAASLTINVDAGVYKTEVSKMPFARVKPMNFTQEQVTGMFNYLFPDEKPNLPRTQMTKK